MAIGTNKDLLGEKEKPNGIKGRPAVDRDLVIRNMKLTDQNGVRRYTDKQLASMAGCSTRSIRRIRKEAEAAGLLQDVDPTKKGIGIVEAELNAEIKRAIGQDFHEWLHTRFKKESQAHSVFNFVSQVWAEVWNKPSLVEFTDRNSQVADDCATKFNQFFGEDRKRMRARIKKISFLYRFMDRESVRKKHLRLDNAKHPRSVRRVPEITSIEFGNQWQQIENIVVDKLGEEARLMLRFKVCSQMRTGDLDDGRELYGLRHDSQGKSYIKFLTADQYTCHIFAKRSEEWDVIWLPREVKNAMRKHLENVPIGEPVWSISKKDLRREFGKATKKITGRRMILHDCRKISVTWLYIMGVSSEVACLLNVGWLDVSTAFKHYLDAKKLLRGSFKESYRENIPDWFRDGLNDFMGQDAYIPSSGGGHW